MMCHFYILYSVDFDKYYLGHTCDTLENRLRRHNSDHKGFTGKCNDWKIVRQEAYATRTEAYQRERQVKRWKSRAKIKELIKS